MAQCDGNAKHTRTVNGNERDCYMGHMPGVTQYKVDDKGNVTEVSDRYRHKLLGKGLHEQHVWSYFYRSNNQPLRLATSMLSQVSTASPEQLELFMSSFTMSDDRCEWLRNNTMSAYKMLELHLTMHLRNGTSQIMHNYGSGGKLDASMEHAIKQLLAEGRIEEVDYHPDFFISPCFPKAKPGIKFEGTDLDLVRLLNDLRGVNACIPDAYDEWAINNPTRENLTRSVPSDAKFFGEIDLKDAFHWGVMHEDSRKCVVIHWKGKFYRWVGVPQGLKPASSYYTAMITHLLNTALGGAGAGASGKQYDFGQTQKASAGKTFPPSHIPDDGLHGGGAAWSVGRRQWYIGWIDDWMPIGPTKQRCQHGKDVLLDVFKVAGLPLSPKCNFKISEMGKLIGMHWAHGGHCLSCGAPGHLSEPS